MANGKLKIDIRREKILSLLASYGQVTVTQLSRELGATSTTIRNDLDSLAANQKLTRIKGGAIASANAVSFPTCNLGTTPVSHLAEKQKIAAEAIRFIKDWDTVFINSGSTGICVAEMLTNRRGLRIVTNSLEVARKLSGRPTFHVVLLGGELNSEHAFTHGGDALSQIRHYQSAWAILSVDGIDANIGIATYHPEEAILNQTMISQAGRTMIVADHRKIGRAGFSHICDVGNNQLLITDHWENSEALDQLRMAGMEVCLA